MQQETANLKVEVSNITVDAIDKIAHELKVSPNQLAAILLSRGFSNRKECNVCRKAREANLV